MTAGEEESIGTPRLQSVAAILGLGLAGALISIFVQGFQFGIDNNVFHIPVVLRWYDDPRWASDAFTQSLRNFTSYVYPLLGLVATRENIGSVFLVAHVISRWGAFVAALLIVRHLGARRPWQLGLASLAIAASPLLRHGTPLGKSGIFIDFFTHTEVTHGPALGAFLLLVEGYPLPAFLLAGLIFDINAFVGVWVAVALGVAEILRQRRNGGIHPVRLAAYTGATLVVALPALVWILRTLSGDRGQPFDFRAYLQAYYPYHFYANASTWLDGLKLAVIVAGGLLAIRGDSPTRRIWRDLYLVLLALFLAGVVAPYVTGNAMVLNLHLMRVDSLLVILAFVFATEAAIRRFADGLTGPTLATAGQGAALVTTLFYDWPVVVVALLLSSTGQAADAIATWSRRTVVRAGLLGSVGLLVILATPWGTGPTLRWGAVAGAVVCLVIGLLTASSFAAAAAVVILSQGDPMLFAASCLYFAAVILHEASEPSSAWMLGIIAAIALMAGAVVVAKDHRLAVLAAAMQCSVALAYPIGRRIAAQLTVAPASVAKLASLLVPAVGLVALVEARRTIPGPTRMALDWVTITDWARDSTPAQSVFLVPFARIRPVGFGLHSERLVWVDWKQGAAVMWEPRFHEQWSQRKRDVEQLNGIEASLTYACAHHLAFVVYDRRKKWPDDDRFNAERVYRTATYDVFKTPECTASPAAPGAATQTPPADSLR